MSLGPVGGGKTKKRTSGNGVEYNKNVADISSGQVAVERRDQVAVRVILGNHGVCRRTGRPVSLVERMVIRK